MKTAGIICEYNPFHLGHKRQITLLREAGFDRIVCLMSGNFVQRGEPALLHRYLRAECACRSGADLVLELPFPYSMASAEYFATAAIRIMKRIGIDALSFGTETKDIGTLKQAANITQTSAFLFKLEQARKEHPDAGSAALYAEVYRTLTQNTYPASPNDLLGVAYLRAMERENAPFDIFPIPRNGSEYSSPRLEEGKNPSATALREAWLTGHSDKLSGFVPQSTLDIVRRACDAGDAPVSPMAFGDLLLPGLRLADPGITENLAELSGGLAHHLIHAANRSTTYPEFLLTAATKKYTDTRIRRAALYAMIGVTRSDLLMPPAYTLLLAANKTGCNLLAELRKTQPGFVVTKPADVPSTEASKRQAQLSARADALYTIAMPKKQESNYFIKYTPVILSGSD